METYGVGISLLIETVNLSSLIQLATMDIVKQNLECHGVLDLEDLSTMLTLREPNHPTASQFTHTQREGNWEEMGSEAAAALGELVAALEQASLKAKQLPSSTTTLASSHILKIYSSLHTAQHHLSLFLSHHSPPPPPPPPLLLTFLPTPPPPPPPLLPENSVCSAVGGGDDNDMDPMQVGDDDDEGVEYNSKNTSTSAAAAAIEIEGVEDRMRHCFIQNKRPKRPLSPSSVELRGRSSADQFDPEGTKLRSLDLIYQFHG